MQRRKATSKTFGVSSRCFSMQKMTVEKIKLQQSNVPSDIKKGLEPPNNQSKI